MTDEPEPRRRGIITLCHECKGSKVVWRPRMYVGGLGTGTITQEVSCPSCKGKGRLPGITPPV